MKVIQILLTFSLFGAAFLGDFIVFKSKYAEKFVFRAISDSLVHGVIGFLSAALFFSYKMNISTQACVFNIIFCTFMSTVIDIDHVFVAKSIHLKDYTNLTQRGIFHCTTFWLLLTTLMLTYSYLYRKFYIYVASFMILLAFTSHHIRDGNRRGLWFFPYGHTDPINKFLYSFLLGILPNIIAYLFLYFKRDFKDVVIDHYTV